jgi:hypothetical protein
MLLPSRRLNEPAPLAVDFTHAVLGDLRGTTESIQGTVPFRGSAIDISIHVDGQPLEPVLGLAERVAANLDVLNERCQSLIADQFLDSYNDGWRMGVIAQGDGTTRPFENPGLSRATFCSNLTVQCVEITGDELAALWYECGDLFWGHCFSVTSFNGAEFTDVRVEMQG